MLSRFKLRVMITLKEIRKLRIALGISQEQLAQMLCIDRSTVAKWETSDGYPRGEKIVELAAILNCSIDELLGVTLPSNRGA